MEFTINIQSGDFEKYEEILKNFDFSSPIDERSLPTITLGDLIDLVRFVADINSTANGQAEVIVTRNLNTFTEISNHIHIRDIHPWTPRSRGYK